MFYYIILKLLIKVYYNINYYNFNYNTINYYNFNYNNNIIIIQ